MKPVAVAIVCKTPAAGYSKTRLSPPLTPEDCSALSACFIQDLSTSIAHACSSGNGTPIAVYTPLGSETRLRALLPDGFTLHLQGDGDLGARLLQATEELIAAGHAGVILINSDSPTLPVSVLRDAIDAVTTRDAVVLGAALDGGYTLIGLSRAHKRLFEDIPWSTETVYDLTLQRAAEIGLPVVNVAKWYDVDDAATLRLLQAEFAGQMPSFAAAGLVGADARFTRQFFTRRA